MNVNNEITNIMKYENNIIMWYFFITRCDFYCNVTYRLISIIFNNIYLVCVECCVLYTLVPLISDRWQHQYVKCSNRYLVKIEISVIYNKAIVLPISTFPVNRHHQLYINTLNVRTFVNCYCYYGDIITMFTYLEKYI